MGANVADGGNLEPGPIVPGPRATSACSAELFVWHHKEVLKYSTMTLGAPSPMARSETARAHGVRRRVARVVVGHGEDEAGLPDQLRQSSSLREAVGHWS